MSTSFAPIGVSAPDVKNLYIELVRNRTKTLYLLFGVLQYGGPYFLISENPLPRVDYFPPVWVPTDISKWRFSFNMSQLTSTITPPNWQSDLKYDPLVNISDPTQGLLTWNIQAVDTVQLDPGNYYFEMTVCSDGSTVRSLCSGAAALIDNLNDFVTTPSIYLGSPLSILCNSIVQFNLEKH